MKTKGRIELGTVTHHNIKQLKVVNQVVFPVSYNEKFYKDVVQAGDLAKLAYFNDIVVGGVCCRLDNQKGQKKLYIMTLGCLAPYRRQGLGCLMLNHVLELCQKDPSIDSICLHVQVNNEDALKFYQKFGFTVVETTQNYYKRIEPADAFYLERRMKDTAVSSAQQTDPETNQSELDEKHSENSSIVSESAENEASKPALNGVN